MRGLYFFPLTTLFVVSFVLFLVLLFVAIQIGLISYAYERLGIDAHILLPLLLLSLLGSAVNLPITEVRGGPRVSQQVVDFFGMRYVIPVIEQREQTVIAINVGGAVVPTAISLYLLWSHWDGQVLFGGAVNYTIFAIRQSQKERREREEAEKQVTREDPRSVALLRTHHFVFSMNKSELSILLIVESTLYCGVLRRCPASEKDNATREGGMDHDVSPL